MAGRGGDRIGLHEEAESIRKAASDMEQAVLDHGWDGQWFLRAYDAYGNKVDSSECAEGQIFIAPQGFCTLAGIGGREYGIQATESTRKHLLGQYGVVLGLYAVSKNSCEFWDFSLKYCNQGGNV